MKPMNIYETKTKTRRIITRTKYFFFFLKSDVGFPKIFHDHNLFGNADIST